MQPIRFSQPRPLHVASRALAPVLLLCLGLLPAQAAFAGAKFVPRLGANASSLSETPAGWSTSEGTGFSAGLDVRTSKGILFFQGGAHYEELGFDLKEPGPIEHEITLKGFDVPILVGLRFSVLGLGAYAGIGPGFTFMSNVDDVSITEEDVASTLVSGRVAVGVDVFILSVEGSYAQGFTNVFENQATYGDGMLDTWRLRIGVGF